MFSLAWASLPDLALLSINPYPTLFHRERESSGGKPVKRKNAVGGQAFFLGFAAEIVLAAVLEKGGR